jgi:hypothetical protein
MQNTRPPLDTTFFETVAAMGIQLPPSIRSFFRRMSGTDPRIEDLAAVRMEEVFKDVFFDFQEDNTDSLARDAYIALVDLYLRVLRDTTNWLCDEGRDGAPVGRLLADAADSAENVTIITFNHDLVIENEIFRRARLRQRWCLDQGYGSFGQQLVLTAPTASFPVFSTHSGGSCDHTRPIKILKLHGSLNWVVRINSIRPSAGILSNGPEGRDLYLVIKRRILGRETIVRTGRGRTRWQTWPIVVPPVYAKHALRSTLQDVWNEARHALEEADRIAFFGYSLPAIDVEAEKLVERALATNSTVRWLDIIDPAPTSAQRYAGLAPAVPIRWYPRLEAFRDAGAFAP